MTATTTTTARIVAVKTAFGWAAMDTVTGEYSDTCSTRREARAVAATWDAIVAAR